MPTRKTTSDDEGKLLTQRAYDRLLAQISQLFSTADKTSKQARVTSTWKIGARLVAAKLSHDVGYHNSVLRDLSADSGISVRVLQESVAFREAYEQAPSNSPLSWSHYRKLIRVPLPERAQLEAAAIEGGWSARDLSAAIDDFFANETGIPTAIERPTDPTYLYAARITEVIDGDTVHADIDLGFAVTRHEKLRLARIDTPEAKSAKGRAAKDYLTRLLHRAATVAIVTERVDLHGRYVAHLFTSDVPTTILQCVQKGLHVNARLLSARHAAKKG